MPRILMLSAALGLAASVSAAQETTTYSYDVHGRLIEVERSSGPETTYAYDDGDSRTLKVTTGAALLEAAATPGGEPAEEVGEVGGQTDLEPPEDD